MRSAIRRGERIGGIVGEGHARHGLDERDTVARPLQIARRGEQERVARQPLRQQCACRFPLSLQKHVMNRRAIDGQRDRLAQAGVLHRRAPALENQGQQLHRRRGPSPASLLRRSLSIGDRYLD